MHTRGISCLVFLIGLFAATLRAEVIVDNLSQPTDAWGGPIGTDNNNNDFLIGQEFTLPAGNYASYTLNKVSLLLSPVGGIAHTTVSIWNVDTNDNPSSQIAVVASQAVPVPERVDFVPSTNIVLAPGMYYVVAAPATPADNAAVNWAYTTNWESWTGTGIMDGFAVTMSGSWTNYAADHYPFQMSVQATPTPGAIAINRRNGVTTLSWPSTLSGFVAETATNLVSSGWQALTDTVTQVQGNEFLTNNSGDAARYFRLRQNYVVNNLEQPVWDWDGPIGSDNNTNDFRMAQEFSLSTGNYAIGKITLLLNPYYGAGSVTVSIWNVGADGNPTNEVAEVASQLVSAEGPVDFIPASPIQLPSGNYFVMATPASANDNGLVGWDYTASTFWTGFGTLGSYADTYAGSWETSSILYGPFQMGIQTVTTSP